MRTNMAPFIAVLILFAAATAGCPCPCHNNANVEMTPFSGRFGYGLEGPHDFVGALTKEALTDANWSLEGEFTFPTGGYTVGEPEVMIAESYPEQVRVTIEVTPPAPGTIVTQVVTKVPVSAQIPASNEATFRIEVVDVS